MEINETLMKNQNDILDSQLKNYTYCCPLCVSLPEILSFNQVRGTVKLKCKQHGENILQIEDYMEKISMLLSILYLLIGYMFVSVVDFIRIKKIPMDEALKNVE